MGRERLVGVSPTRIARRGAPSGHRGEQAADQRRPVRFGIVERQQARRHGCIALRPPLAIVAVGGQGTARPDRADSRGKRRRSAAAMPSSYSTATIPSGRHPRSIIGGGEHAVARPQLQNRAVARRGLRDHPRGRAPGPTDGADPKRCGQEASQPAAIGRTGEYSARVLHAQ